MIRTLRAGLAFTCPRRSGWASFSPSSSACGTAYARTATGRRMKSCNSGNPRGVSIAAALVNGSELFPPARAQSLPEPRVKRFQELRDPAQDTLDNETQYVQKPAQQRSGFEQGALL